MMKPKEDILRLLVARLAKHKYEASTKNQKGLYFNECLDDISHLIAGILHIELSEKKMWSSNKWIDDCLMTNVILDYKKTTIKGVMIWGIDDYDTMQQWTDPFCFELFYNEETKMFNYLFALGNQHKEELDYDAFASNRIYWNDFLSNINTECNFDENTWKYIINNSINLD